MKVQEKPDGTVVIEATPKPKIELPKYDGRRRVPDWIRGFLEYTNILDVPIDYLRWAAISTIAGAAQRKIYMDMAHFEVMSNLYVVLVGPPGAKKSTAIRTGLRLLKKIPGIHMAPDAPSVPGLMEEFKELKEVQKDHQSLNAFILELSSLYENAPEAMTDWLTKAYDCDEDLNKRTRIGGKEHIPFPWLNLIAGTTPSWIGRNIGDSELEGGLEARKIHVGYFGPRILKSARPKLTPRHKQLREDLIHDLAHISSLNGAFDFEGGEDGVAFNWYDAWYQDSNVPDGHRESGYRVAAEIEAELGYRNLEKTPPVSRFPRLTDFRTDGYYNRKHIHLLKVAMAVALSRKDDLVLTLEELLVAKALLEAIELDMPKVYSSVGGNNYMTDIERIHRSIVEAGKAGIGYSEILNAHVQSTERRYIDDALVTLEKMGDIKKVLDGNAKPPENRYFAI